MTGEEPLSGSGSKQTSKTSAKRWLKRIGIAGFLFFLIKGILWLVLLGLVIFGIVDQEAVERFRDWLPF